MFRPLLIGEPRRSSVNVIKIEDKKKCVENLSAGNAMRPCVVWCGVEKKGEKKKENMGESLMALVCQVYHFVRWSGVILLRI